MECFREQYWAGLPFPTPGDLPDPGIESRSPALQADFFFFNNFIYFWLHWTFVAVQGLSLVVVLRLLTVVASLVSELRL